MITDLFIPATPTTTTITNAHTHNTHTHNGDDITAYIFTVHMGTISTLLIMYADTANTTTTRMLTQDITTDGVAV